jgi:hypothetical protein
MENYNELLSGIGKCDVPSNAMRMEVVYRTSVPFTVLLNGIIIGPNSSTDRFYKMILEPNNDLEFIPIELPKSAPYSLHVTSVPQSSEAGGGEDLLQEEEPLTQYDMLAMKYEAKFRAYAEANNLDTFDDENDSWDEDEDNSDSPLTHYEAKVMVDELPVKVVKEKEEKFSNKKEETTDEKPDDLQ